MFYYFSVDYDATAEAAVLEVLSLRLFQIIDSVRRFMFLRMSGKMSSVCGCDAWPSDRQITFIPSQGMRPEFRPCHHKTQPPKLQRQTDEIFARGPLPIEEINPSVHLRGLAVHSRSCVRENRSIWGMFGVKEGGASSCRAL